MAKEKNKVNGEITNTEQPVDVLDYATVFMKWRKFIIQCTVIVTVLAGIIAFILPRWYKATASILPPKDQAALNPFGSASSLLRNVGALQRIPGMGAISGPYNYLAILKSRSVMEGVVVRFDLITVYGVSDRLMELAVKELKDNVNFEVQNEDYITVEILDKDPQRAADMANYFVQMLNEISIRLGTQEAKNNREFIEQRVSKIYADLHQAEDLLKKYQEKSPIAVPPEMSSSGIWGVAELYALKAKKEIEIGVLERTVSSDNQFLRQERIELGEINKKVEKIPEVGLETVRLYREVMIQQKILEYVIPLLEQAKVDEQKTVPVLLVLDKAVVPEKKEKPKRLLIIVVAMLSGLLLSYFVALLAESLKKREQDPQWLAKLAAIKHESRSFFDVFRRS